MGNAIEAVKNGEAIAAVSAGNTGVLMGMSLLILRTIEGGAVPRSSPAGRRARASPPCLDLGADIDADAEQLVEFAIMGQAYFRAVQPQGQSSIGLPNIGSRSLKGRESIRDAAKLIREGDIKMNFHGFYRRRRYSLKGTVDVDWSTDGSTGNVALKTAEGLAAHDHRHAADCSSSCLFAMLGALLSPCPRSRNSGATLDPRTDQWRRLQASTACRTFKRHGGTDKVGFEQAIPGRGQHGREPLPVRKSRKACAG